MNNEQNNMFGIPNQGQPNNQTIPGNTTVPGANLTPIGPNDNMIGETVNQSETNLNSIINNIDTQPIEQNVQPNLTPNPIPGIVTGPQPVNPPNIPSTPINTLPTENVVPGINDGAMNINNNMNTSNLNVMPNSMEQSAFSPNIPVSQPSMYNEPASPVNNNLGDATPLTNEGMNGESSDTVSVMKYLGHMILFSIPLVGFIMLLIKAFGGEKNKNIKNYAKAQLLLAVIMVVLGIVASIAFGAVLVNLVSGLGGSSSDLNNSYDYDDYYSSYDYDYDYDFDY